MNWLSIVGAGKTAIILKDSPLFQQSVTFTHDGTWTVPDAYEDGSKVEVEVEAVASGGGGGGGAQLYGSTCTPVGATSGGNGGTGGKATTFCQLLPGTVVTIKFDGGNGAGGAQGNLGAYHQFYSDHAANSCGLSPATAGGDGHGVTVTHNQHGDPTVICSATPGTKGRAVNVQYNGSGPDDFGALLPGTPGANGTGLGDFPSSKGGDGGIGGLFAANIFQYTHAKLGGDGRVTIHW